MRIIRRRLQLFLALLVMITAIGTAGFMALEDLSLPEALYFNLVTMSTVGYGDIHPTSNPSRLFAILLIVLGGRNLYWRYRERDRDAYPQTRATTLAA